MDLNKFMVNIIYIDQLFADLFNNANYMTLAMP